MPSVSLQNFDQLNAVSAAATDDVWAVGQISLRDALFIHWDGGAWNIVDSPPDAGRQFAVAALASDDLWSAGEGRRASNTGLFNHWDGTSWTTIPNPSTNSAPKRHVISSRHRGFCTGMAEAGRSSTGRRRLTCRDCPELLPSPARAFGALAVKMATPLRLTGTVADGPTHPLFSWAAERASRE